MAEGIKVDAEHFINLLDLEERKEKEVDTFYGSTLFRYFRYKNKPCLPEDEPWYCPSELDQSQSCSTFCLSLFFFLLDDAGSHEH
jgi:hypothetical protein